jgi:CelD/BcsL family acetyltransferase involved in cellulose biosynthesis
MKYKIEIIDSLDSWKKSRVDWNRLLKNSISNTVFLTWEWLFSWSKCYLNANRRLFIVCIYKDLELIGIAPWYINHTKYKLLNMRRIEFLGSPEAGSDYLDVIARRGKEQEVVASLYEFLFDQGRSFWDCMLLREIPSSSLFLLHFLNKIEVDGKYAEIRHGSYCPVVSLPAERDDFLLTLSSNRREQFRRHWRMLNNHAGVGYRSFSSDDCNGALDELCELFKEKNKYYNESLSQFIRIFASQCNNNDWLQIDLLSSDGKNIAALLHLRYQEELSMFLMTVDKDFEPKISIGNVLVGLSIQRAVDQKLTSYDFLKGIEDYKFHWADKGRRSLDILFCRKKLSPIMFLTERFIKYAAKTLLR